MKFSDLKLTRDPITGAAEFDWGPIEAICEASGIDITLFRDQHEDNVSGLIVAWYAAHRAHGGAPDPVQDDLIAKAIVEDALGGGISHESGRA